MLLEKNLIVQQISEKNVLFLFTLIGMAIMAYAAIIAAVVITCLLVDM